MKKLKLARKFIVSQGGFVSTKTPDELGLKDNGDGTLSRRTKDAADLMVGLPHLTVNPSPPPSADNPAITTNSNYRGLVDSPSETEVIADSRS